MAANKPEAAPWLDAGRLRPAQAVDASLSCPDHANPGCATQEHAAGAKLPQVPLPGPEDAHVAIDINSEPGDTGQTATEATKLQCAVYGEGCRKRQLDQAVEASLCQQEDGQTADCAGDRRDQPNAERVRFNVCRESCR